MEGGRKMTAAERRRARILKDADSRVRKLTGEDRTAPSLEFQSRNPAGESVDPAVAERINKLLQGRQNLTEPRLANPYIQQSPRNHPSPPTSAAANAHVPISAIPKVGQFAAILLLCLCCFLLRINYGVALASSLLLFASLQFFRIRNFIHIPPFLSMIPGKLQYLAKAGFFAYSMWDIVLMHLLCIVLVQVLFSVARGVDLVFEDPAAAMDSVTKTINSIKEQLPTHYDDPDDKFDVEFDVEHEIGEFLNDDF